MADGSVHRATGRIWLTKLLDAFKVLQLNLLRLERVKVTVITGWPGVTTMSLSGIGNLTCSFCLCVAARIAV